MRRHIYTILVVTMMGAPALAAAPDLLPPLSMLVDSGNTVGATGMDFLSHPQSGSVNFNPNNYDIHLPGDLTLPVQDVVAYNGVMEPLGCEAMAKLGKEALESVLTFFGNLIAKVGLPVGAFKQIDANKFSADLLAKCKMLPLAQQNASTPYQVLADVRNTASAATDVIFSGQHVDPYTTGLPWAAGSVGATVDLGPNAAGTDSVLIASPHSFLGTNGFSKPWSTPMLSASLSLFRFGPKVLQFNSYSSAWLDRPLGTPNNITNPACFAASADPKNPVVPKSDAELLKFGCMGEGDVVAIATPHLYTNTNKELEDQKKSQDLVVVSRSPMGDPKSPASKIGYITIYRRTATVPGDASIFQDLWQFDKSVTNAASGISEPYGIAVVKNWDAKTGKPVTDGVVVGSNKLQATRYYVYYYTNDGAMKEPKAILVGGTTNQGLPGFGGFGPYGVYSSDFNADKCGDIAITRAKIAQDGKAIQFADYFDVHIQRTGANGDCTGTFDSTGTKYQIPPIDPQKPPQISSLVIADINKDGRNDVVAGDFTTYLDSTTKERINYVHFLEYMGGLFNTVNPPHYLVTTKGHADDVGVIDVKADTHANLGVVTGNAMVFAPWMPPPVIPNPCAKDPNTGMVDPKLIDPATCGICRPGSDADKDGLDDFPAAKSVKVKTCVNGVMVDQDMFLNPSQDFTYSPDCKISTTKTGRQWMHEWAGCDNCGGTDTCNGAEDGDAAKNNCWNQPQTDDNSDGYGNICSPGKPVIIKSEFCGVSGKVYDASWLDPALNNDTDKDGIPDCVVYLSAGNPTTGNCKMRCDNCSQFQAPDLATMNACKADISKCANPDQKDTAASGYGDVCNAAAANGPPTKCLDGTAFDATWFNALDPTWPQLDPNNDMNKNGIPDCKVYTGADGKLYKDCKSNCDGNNPQQVQLKMPREDKVMYADDQPVIAYQEDLKMTGVPPAPADSGNEVTVLLNKTNVKSIPPPCQNGDLNCICQQNPDLQICKCQKDPNAPGCVVGPMPQVTCCLDVCRGDLTAPFPVMCDVVRPYNDQIRKITGLCLDVLVPVEGTQYHLSCTMPNAPALDLGAGKAYAQVFKASGGQIPKNYFKNWLKPVASQNLLTNNVLLNPADDAASGGVPLDLNKLPKPSFSFDASLSAIAPDASINQAPGITQIDGVMQIETYLADVDPATGAPAAKQAIGPGGGAPVITKALLLDIKGYSSPPGCQWSGSDCPEPMPNPPPPQAFVDAIRGKVAEFEAAGKPVTIDTINEAFKSMDVGPAFMHQQFVVAGSQGAMVMPLQNVMGGFSLEAGCGCTFASTSTMHNTVLPLLMAIFALGGMAVLRRNTAKKH